MNSSSQYFWIFVWAVADHTVTLAAGCIVTVMLGLLEKYVLKRPISWKIEVAVLLSFLFFACFQAWKDEYTRAGKLEVTLNQRPAAPFQINMPPAQIVIEHEPAPNPKNHQIRPMQGLTGFMQLEGIYVRPGFDTLGAGQHLEFNVLVEDQGSEPVHNAIAWTDVVSIDRPGWDADKKAWELFDRDIKSLQAEYSQGKARGTEVGAKKGIWGTFSLPTYSQQEAGAVLNGERRIYFFTWTAWTDYQGRKGSSENCRWLQNPNSAKITNDFLVWRFCSP